MDDISILNWAHQYENKPHLNKALSHWERPPGASTEDMRRLLDGGFIEITSQTGNRRWYKLTKASQDLLFNARMEKEMTKIPADSIIEAMDLIVGFEDVKQRLARGIENRPKGLHFLLIGPPACAKSLFLEAIRSAVPRVLVVFGRSTSDAGLSDALFENQPEFMLADEMDKMKEEVYSIMLSLLEKGEILVTKSGKCRGIQLHTMVFGACNSTDRMSQELFSRFLPIYFPHYTREEFIDVCCGYLDRTENCPRNIGTLIGQEVYDRELGDVRKARQIWGIMNAPTESEVYSAINFLMTYGENNYQPRKRVRVPGARLPGF